MEIVEYPMTESVSPRRVPMRSMSLPNPVCPMEYARRGSERAMLTEESHKLDEPGLPNGIRHPERDGDIRIVRISPVIFEVEIGSEERKSLAVDVVDDRGSEQQPANPPT